MRFLTLATLAATVVATAAPAFAQSVEEFTVYGRHRYAEPDTMSERVSYADLDLVYAADRAELMRRVNYAARDVCDRLNEAGPSPANLGRSCRDEAVRGAMGQVRYAFDRARQRLAYNEY